jgi:predicted solute-binding protein
MHKLRIGVVSYLNAMPLWYGLQHDPTIELVPDQPARLADMMERRELDVALLPAVEVLRDPSLHFLPDLGVAADGVVESVGLFTREEPANIRSVALTTASRTSVALTRVVLTAAGASPEYTQTEVLPDDLAKRPEDAVLMIGDACLRARKQETDRVFIDLAAEWKLLTGLPMVFAVWAGRKETLSAELHDKLRGALGEGTELTFDMVRHASVETGWSESELGRYLGEVIQHKLTPQHLKGLLEFARRTQTLGLIPASGTDKVLDVLKGSEP